MIKRILSHTLAAALLAACAFSAEARQVSNYFEGFDNVQTGQDQSAIGWSRIFDYTPLGAISYRVEALGGMDDPRSRNTTVLSVQWQETWDDETGAVYATNDMIVTPMCAGEVKFYLKKKGSQASSIPKIKVYECTYLAPMEYETGMQLDLGNVTVSATEWVPVTLYLDEPKQLAIWMEHCYFDSFSADLAEVPDIRLVQLNGLGAVGAKYTAYADKEGRAEFDMQVRLTNRGNQKLTAGETDYSIDVQVNQSKIATVPVPVDLEPGDEYMMPFKVPYTLADPKVSESFSLICVENLMRTVSSTAVTLNVNACIPELAVYYDGAPVGSSLDLGMADVSAPLDLTFKNNGSSPLTVNGISVSGDATLDAATPFVLDPGQSKVLSLVIADKDFFSGRVDIDSDTEGSMTGFTFSGARVAQGTYVQTFDDGKLPARWIVERSGAWTPSDKALRSATSASAAGKVILPLLDVAQGEKLIFAVAKTTTASYADCNVAVYTSADRIHWAQAVRHSSTQENSVIPATRGEYAFTAVDIPAGAQYVAFEGLYVSIDNVALAREADCGHDIYVHAFTADNTGMVNYPLNASVTVQNVGPAHLEAHEYSVELLLDGKTVASIEAPGRETLLNDGGKTFTYTFKAIPHAAAAAEIKAVVKTAEGPFESPVAKAQIAAEVFSNQKVVGALNAEETHPSIPVRAGDNNSYSEFVYTAAQLGLERGDRISKLAFYYSITAERNPEKHIKMWMENTELTSAPTPASGKAFADTASMTKVAEKDFIFAFTPASNGDFGKFNLLTLPFDEPFEYTGSNIRIIVASESNNFVAASFLVFSQGKTLWASNDVLAQAKAATPMSTSYLPNAKLTIDKVAPVVSGTVTDGAAALAGACITLESNGVEYYGTTDATGRYSVQIKQPSRSYVTTLAAHTCKDAAMEAAAYLADTDQGTVALVSNSVDKTTVSYSYDAATASATIEWEALTLGSLDTAVSYDLSVDGTPVASGLTEPSHTLQNVAAGVHTLVINAKFEPTGQYSAPVTVSTDQTGISAVETAGYAIKACSGGVEFTVSTPSQALVYTLDGRTVASQTVETGSTLLELPRGSYVARVGNVLAVKIIVK